MNKTSKTLSKKMRCYAWGLYANGPRIKPMTFEYFVKFVMSYGKKRI